MSLSPKDEDDQLDLDRGLPTRPTDVEALRRNQPAGMTFEQYLRFLRRVVHASWQPLRDRPGPRGVPFTLDASD